MSILEESQDTLQIWLEDTPKDLSIGINLHLVDDENEILNGGRIIVVRFKDTTDHDDIEESQEPIHSEEEASETGPAIVTTEKWQYEIVEHSNPEDGPID